MNTTNRDALSGRMPPDTDEMLSVGALVRRRIGLTTREVVAMAFAVSGDPGCEFPRSPDDVWVRADGGVEVEIDGSDDTAMTPPAAIANLLDALLPHDARDAAFAVSPALRGLPERLRGVSANNPNVRTDLQRVPWDFLEQQSAYQLLDRGRPNDAQY